MVDPADASGLALRPTDVGRLFPFFVEIDANGRVSRLGSSLRRVCPELKPGGPCSEAFEFVRPEGDFNLETLRESPTLLSLLRERSTSLPLRGQWVALEEGGVVFLGSPWLSDTSELAKHHLSIEDFAIHDPAVDLLQILRSQKMATDDLRRLTDRLTKQRAKLREANARLTEQEAESRRLALIAARTDNAVVLTDAQGRTEWVNSGFERLTGYTLDDVKGRAPGSLLQGPDTDPAVVRRMHEQITARRGFTAEIINYHKSCRRYWVTLEVQPITDDEGEVTHFMAIESDITARRASEANLRVQFTVSQILAAGTSLDEVAPALLKAIGTELEWSIAQLWMYDEENARLVLTESWTDEPSLLEAFLERAQQPSLTCDVGLPGLTWREQGNQWVENISDYPECPRSNAAHASGLLSAVAFPLNVGSLRLGVIELMSRRHEPVDSARRQVLEAVGVQIAQFVERARSREELRRRTDELAELNRQLESASRAKSEFLASISHEIRTPLNGVIGAADALEGTPLAPDQREALSTLGASANHLHSLLNDVLDFSRIEAGRLELETQPVLVHSIVEDLTRIFQPVARNRSLQFRIECPIEKTLCIDADATRIRQILVNLLGNAFKFTESGSVTFHTQVEEDADRVRVDFEIRDTGIGIPSDRAELLFKPFSQLDASHTRRFGGTGLGLAISQRLAGLMDGTLGLRESSPAGSRFGFSFLAPRATMPARRAETTGRFTADAPLLIVDDHESNATVLKMLLTQLGLRGYHAPSAEDALAYCATHAPPAILMDVHMPNVDGMEATRRIRAAASPDDPVVPIIALTADVRPEVRPSCIDVGMNGFLSKPIRLAELRAVLNEHLQAEPATDTDDARNSATADAPQPDNTHGLDEDIVEAIYEHGEDHATAHEVAMMFNDMWRDVPAGLERIELARSNGDVTDGQAQCHRVRGVLANYGFQRAADLLGEMETSATVFNRAASMAAVRGLLQAGHQELLRRYAYLGRV